MNFITDALGSLTSMGQGFWEGLTGASQRKKERAKQRQKQASRGRREAQTRAHNAHAQVSRLATQVRQSDQRQNSMISAAQQLAQRSMSTAKAAAFQSQQLQGLVSGIRRDFKELAARSAGTEALAQTNKLVSELTEQVEAMAEADKAYKAATEEALEALNQEASDTTEHLEALTQANQKKTGWDATATDLLPWARVALQALNLERPKNEVFYYLSLVAGPFLRERVDAVTAELLTTGLQILAYWDDEGLQGLFRSRDDTGKLQAVLSQKRKEDERIAAFFERSDVRKLLGDAGIAAPK